MREYETVFITQPSITESLQTQISEKITSLVKKHNGELFYSRNMGNRTLAYPIKKMSKGIYTCVDFAASGTAIGDIERYLKYEDNVIRYLTVVKNENVDIEARIAEIAARGEDASLPFSEEADRRIEAGTVPTVGIADEESQDGEELNESSSSKMKEE